MKRTNKQQRQTSPGRALEPTYKTSATQWDKSPRNNPEKGEEDGFDLPAATHPQQAPLSSGRRLHGWREPGGHPLPQTLWRCTEVPSLIRLSPDQQGRDVRRRLEPGGNTGTAHSSRTAGAAGATDRGSQRAACASEKARLPRSPADRPSFHRLSLSPLPSAVRPAEAWEPHRLPAQASG